MIRRLALLGLLVAGRVVGAQSPAIRLDDAGPGVGPRVLADALNHPYTVAPQGSGRLVVERGSENRQSLVVLGRDAVIEGRVQGDVVVIGGDLYMHPGGAIEGRALAFGGGVYESSLATIAGGSRAFHDFTYDIGPVAGGFSLRYRSLVVQPEAAGLSLPGVYGIASPEYDRSDGLSIGFAPRYAARGTALVLAPKVTYRSQLGAIDPSLGVEYGISRRTTLTARAERATRSNDRWIREDLLNSATFFWNGNDIRNYYRATSVEARLAQSWESVGGEVTPYIGARAEDAKSVRPDATALGGPWTVLERDDKDREDRLRLNPAIDEGKTYSGLFGGTWRWTDGGFRVRTKLDGEVGVFDPNSGLRDRSTFGQATLQGHVEFPTFSQQAVLVDGHFVATSRGSTPRQRFAYFGGPGTFPMIDLFSEGGDELVYVDARYVIPVLLFTLPFVGQPVVSLHEVLGGATVQAFPAIHQAVGARIGFKMFYAEWMIDPDTHRKRGGVGVTLTP